jgi:hypothetical protein
LPDDGRAAILVVVTASAGDDDLEQLRRLVRAAGFEWSDTELRAARGLVTQASAASRTLRALPLSDLEPATQYRVL